MTTMKLRIAVNKRCINKQNPQKVASGWSQRSRKTLNGSYGLGAKLAMDGVLLTSIDQAIARQDNAAWFSNLDCH